LRKWLSDVVDVHEWRLVGYGEAYVDIDIDWPPINKSSHPHGMRWVWCRMGVSFVGSSDAFIREGVIVRVGIESKIISMYIKLLMSTQYLKV
jgi:hypothetical protein